MLPELGSEVGNHGPEGEAAPGPDSGYYREQGRHIKVSVLEWYKTV